MLLSVANCAKVVAMKRVDALTALRDNRAKLQELGVMGLYLFGSVARDEARDESDVDLLVDPQSETFSIFSLARVQDECERILGAPAELHDFGGYQRLPQFRKRIATDIIRVF